MGIIGKKERRSIVWHLNCWGFFPVNFQSLVDGGIHFKTFENVYKLAMKSPNDKANQCKENEIFDEIVQKRKCMYCLGCKIFGCFLIYLKYTLFFRVNIFLSLKYVKKKKSHKFLLEIFCV